MLSVEDYQLLLSHDPPIGLTKFYHSQSMWICNWLVILTGIEIGGVKWSPSQWKYKFWAGLYQNKEQYLYVNRGRSFGLSGQ